MLVIGWPTQQQKDRKKPERLRMRHIVHENGYRRGDGAELREMFSGRTGARSFEDYLKAFCARKYNSDFSREMTRSVEAYLRDFEEESI